MSDPVPVDRRKKLPNLELSDDARLDQLERYLDDLRRLHELRDWATTTGRTVADHDDRLNELTTRLDELVAKVDHVAWELLAVKRVILGGQLHSAASFFDPNDPIPPADAFNHDA
ncbi:hypothetical protein [Agromyces larvae]|uniref:Uncharacterized protein n=1 Tax=Agromyces larvae TaxID=2929802 RepID=A0ABY4BU22_9MICO|nr:hypothetical protein [Agromyces larvae]UOE42713.1 hypothetical protein MTO99_10960 [Agromyces larvae]